MSISDGFAAGQLALGLAVVRPIARAPTPASRPWCQRRVRVTGHQLQSVNAWGWWGGGPLKAVRG